MQAPSKPEVCSLNVLSHRVFAESKQFAPRKSTAENQTFSSSAAGGGECEPGQNRSNAPGRCGEGPSAQRTPAPRDVTSAAGGRHQAGVPAAHI